MIAKIDKIFFLIKILIHFMIHSFLRLFCSDANLLIRAMEILSIILLIISYQDISLIFSIKNPTSNSYNLKIKDQFSLYHHSLLIKLFHE